MPLAGLESAIHTTGVVLIPIISLSWTCLWFKQ